MVDYTVLLGPGETFGPEGEGFIAPKVTKDFLSVLAAWDLFQHAPLPDTVTPIERGFSFKGSQKEFESFLNELLDEGETLQRDLLQASKAFLEEFGSPAVPGKRLG